MAKLEVIRGGKSPNYECYFCHGENPERLTQCPSCGQFDTMVRQDGDADPIEEERNGRPAKHAVKLTLRCPKFYSTGSEAWDTVLGGGFVKPSSTLIYGPRGVGKSTRALAIALHLAVLTRGKVLYGSAEMPAEHVRLYAERIGVPRVELNKLWVQDSNDALDMLANIEQERPTIVVWDSIQRFTWEGDLGDVELRQVVHHAIDAGKHYKMITLLLSQVSKEDVFLGPNGIGHDVDVMVRLTREDRDLIVETPDKNRFAPTPMCARETFLAQEPKSVAVDEVPVTIEDDEATRDWFAKGHSAEQVRAEDLEKKR